MGSLKDAAKAYENTNIKNISDLDVINVDVDIQEETKTNSAGETYVQKFIVVDGEKYRVPITVLSTLKEILVKKPDLKTFCVSRVGTTKDDTKYTVIPL